MVAGLRGLNGLNVAVSTTYYTVCLGESPNGRWCSWFKRFKPLKRSPRSKFKRLNGLNGLNGLNVAASITYCDVCLEGSPNGRWCSWCKRFKPLKRSPTSKFKRLHGFNRFITHCNLCLGESPNGRWCSWFTRFKLFKCLNGAQGPSLNASTV